uniref:Pre-mRNA-splicing factor ATP-dependent RNA helicase DHX16 n=1 Tax=Cajanus cajan TaxID=3821 RepID=A0A151SLM0_CAJCA|nr:Putative pre-mRNA-splicing factor ATP-dependent RNA helicase DHX16 [Cajanus cajan]
MKRARDIRDQLAGLLERVEIELTSNANDLDAIKKTITSGFFPHTARLQKYGSYQSVKLSQTVHIHPNSGLVEVLPRWVVYHELVLTTKEYMRQVIELKPECFRRLLLLFLLMMGLMVTVLSLVHVLVIELKPEWLVEIAPHYYQLKDVEDSSSKKLPRGPGRAQEDR